MSKQHAGLPDWEAIKADPSKYPDCTVRLDKWEARALLMLLEEYSSGDQRIATLTEKLERSLKVAQ